MKGLVYNNEKLAGTLERDEKGVYFFIYDDLYLDDPQNPPISLTLSRNRKVHIYPELFPFFAGLLSEGANKEIQCEELRIDEADDFKRLMMTAGTDTIGAITVKQAV